jgi:hypothetical protein
LKVARKPPRDFYFSSKHINLKRTRELFTRRAKDRMASKERMFVKGSNKKKYLFFALETWVRVLALLSKGLQEEVEHDSESCMLDMPLLVSPMSTELRKHVPFVSHKL